MHLVARQEGDGLFHVARVVTLATSLSELLHFGLGCPAHCQFMHIIVIEVIECRFQSIVQIAEEEAIVSELVRCEARHLELQLLHLHLVEELARHPVPLRLLLFLVLQVRADDVKDAVA